MLVVFLEAWYISNSLCFLTPSIFSSFIARICLYECFRTAWSQARDASLRAAEAEDDAGALAGGAPGGPEGLSGQGTQRKPTGSVDLQSVAFHQGGHLMANTKVKLPDGAQRIETKARLFFVTGCICTLALAAAKKRACMGLYFCTLIEKCVSNE